MLKPDGLRGARIGIPRAFFYDRVAVPGTDRPRGGLNPAQTAVMAEAIGVLKQQGAIVVDPVEIPSVMAKDPQANFLVWGACCGLDDAKGKDEDCSVDLKYGMKRDFNTWLASLGAAAPVKTLAELRAWNTAHEKAGAIKYGQSQLDISDEMDVDRDRERYEADRKKDIRLAGTNGIDAAMKAGNLDALLFPGSSGAAIAARPGYPTVIVPFGMVPNVPSTPVHPARPRTRFHPASIRSRNPMGSASPECPAASRSSFNSGYAFEQATKKRVAPKGR